MQLDFKGKWNILLVRNSIPCPLWVSNFKFAFQRFVSPPRRKPRLPQDYVPRPNYAAEIWKRCFHSKSASNVFCPHYSVGIWKRNNHRPFWISGWGKLGQGNHVIIVTSSFTKSSVFKLFSVHTKTQSRRFQIPPVQRAFSKSSVFVTDWCGRQA